ncbi:MAG: hypothetical protein V8T38_16890, partial [Oscillospiraceae bacterium]
MRTYFGPQRIYSPKHAGVIIAEFFAVSVSMSIYITPFEIVYLCFKPRHSADESKFHGILLEEIYVV